MRRAFSKSLFGYGMIDVREALAAWQRQADRNEGVRSVRRASIKRRIAGAEEGVRRIERAIMRERDEQRTLMSDLQAQMERSRVLLMMLEGDHEAEVLEDPPGVIERGRASSGLELGPEDHGVGRG